MNYIGKFISNFKDFYNDINSATLTGAIDVIVVQQPDGTFSCSPFHVRFGKIGVLRSREKVVDIEVNGQPVDIHMKLGESGEAFFVEEVEDENEIPVHLATSPLPAVPDIGKELEKMKLNDGVATCAETSRTHGEGSDIQVFQDNIPSMSDADWVETEHLARQGHAAKDPEFLRRSSEKTAALQSAEDRDSSGGEQKLVKRTGDNAGAKIHSKDKVVDMSFREIAVSSDVADSEDGYKTRKRKKKKISNKKRTKSREVSIPGSLNSDKRERSGLEGDSSEHVDATVDRHSDNPEDIFQMDNDYAESEDDEGYPCAGSLSRSVSLPVNCGKSSLCGEELGREIRKMSSTFTGEFHPFSDGDVTPHSSPTGSRPPSPKSDTEYENQKLEFLSQDSSEPSWGWGQLPNVPRRESSTQLSGSEQTSLQCNADNLNKAVDSDEAEKRSMLGGMLNFMRSTKKYRHMPESEGIYLDSINANSLDPEVAALYFPKFRSVCLPSKEGTSTPPLNDEDAESGKGPSLPHSPHSVEGAIGGPSSQDSDNDDRHFSFGCYNDVAMSLCGGLQDADADLPEEKFMNSLVTYEEFTENPSLLFNPNLVLRVGGKYYNWQTAAPMIVSTAVFQRILPEKTRNQLISEHMPKKKKAKSYSSWWSWRRSEAEPKQEPQVETQQPMEHQPDGAESKSSSMTTIEVVMKHPESSEVLTSETEAQSNSFPTTDLTVKDELCQQTLENGISRELLVAVTQASSETSSRDGSPRHDDTPASHTKDELSVPEFLEAEQDGAKGTDAGFKGQAKEKCRKSLRLTSEQIVNLNLQPGPNEVVFSVTTAYQGTTRCKCDIYLWSYDDKIVISDIDGTITKSDVLGHILPMVGKDWAQLGVASLFTKVKENGYQFLYLSARAIGQARITREYLRSIRQGEVCLPDGPLLLSPTSLMNALHREVIEKKPEVFKINCLKDIQTLYPSFMGNPFYAGFGNKINDTWAYRAVGIPTTRIFTINHRGELRLELIQTFQSSYTRLSDQVDHMFPPLKSTRQINGRFAPSFTASEEFSYFTYWREPVDSVSDDDELPE